jgi:hypothetical protein
VAIDVCLFLHDEQCPLVLKNDAAGAVVRRETLLYANPNLSTEAALLDLALQKRGLWLACPDILFFTRWVYPID